MQNNILSAACKTACLRDFKAWRDMWCMCIHVACREHDQGQSLTTETELNWVKLIHFPAEIFPRAPRGKSQLHLTSH